MLRSSWLGAAELCMTSPDLVLFPVVLDAATDPLVKAVAAYLARYRNQTRVHTESDLRAYLVWCRERGVEPLAVSRAQIELYLRWMQEVRHFQPSKVSRRVSVVARFYRTCVIDQGSRSHRRSMCGARTYLPSRPLWGCRTCSSRRC